MFQIIGIVLLFAMVFGGYVISGGHFEVIIESMPHEMMTIGGAAVAALLLGNSIGDVKKTLVEMSRAFSGPKWKQSDYRDLLCLLFLLTKTMKMKGMIGGALVGTFLGVFLAYGLVGPISTRLKGIVEEDAQFYHVIRDILVAHLHGNSAQVSVEIGRGSVPSTSQPTFQQLEESLNTIPADVS